jgi:hypothetical protein
MRTLPVLTGVTVARLETPQFYFTEKLPMLTEAEHQEREQAIPTDVRRIDETASIIHKYRQALDLDSMFYVQ